VIDIVHDTELHRAAEYTIYDKKFNHNKYNYSYRIHKMVFLGLRGKKLLAGITVSSGLGFILFGTRSRPIYTTYVLASFT
jgi:hypothetical protein